MTYSPAPTKFFRDQIKSMAKILDKKSIRDYCKYFVVQNKRVTASNGHVAMSIDVWDYNMEEGYYTHKNGVLEFAKLLMNCPTTLDNFAQLEKKTCGSSQGTFDLNPLYMDTPDKCDGGKIGINVPTTLGTVSLKAINMGYLSMALRFIPFIADTEILFDANYDHGAITFSNYGVSTFNETMTVMPLYKSRPLFVFDAKPKAA